MSETTPRYLVKLASKLFSEPEVRESFIRSLESPTSRPQGIVWLGERPAEVPWEVAPRVEWQPPWVDRVAASVGVGKSSLHDQGAIYCLDMASVFCGTALSEVKIPHRFVIDLCASPGGKTILAYRHLQPERILCNETIGSRLPGLISNLKRCKISHASVMTFDSQMCAQRLPCVADLVIVDAPCSGQSLRARGEDSPGCFHPSVVNKNSIRQRRIMAHAGEVVAPGGFLAYMTCTFSEDENEDVVRWFLKKFPHFQAISVPHLTAYQSTLTESPSYRIYPHEGIGAGGFVALLRRSIEGERGDFAEDEFSFPWSNQQSSP